MLRFDYMRSDFHPIFLFLGDVTDLTALVNCLRKFAANTREMSVTENIPNSKSRTGLTLVPTDNDFGLRQVDEAFEWKLNAWQAESIADRIELLASEESKSGSDVFEIGSDGEIPVKVSKGEFTDDFLVTKL